MRPGRADAVSEHLPGSKRIKEGQRSAFSLITGAHAMAKPPPRLTTVPDADALAQAAATRLMARLAEPRDRFAVCLTGGSSPEGLYRLLPTAPFRSHIP